MSKELFTMSLEIQKKYILQITNEIHALFDELKIQKDNDDLHRMLETQKHIIIKLVEVNNIQEHFISLTEELIELQEIELKENRHD